MPLRATQNKPVLLSHVPPSRVKFPYLSIIKVMVSGPSSLMNYCPTGKHINIQWDPSFLEWKDLSMTVHVILLRSEFTSKHSHVMSSLSLCL